MTCRDAISCHLFFVIKVYSFIKGFVPIGHQHVNVLHFTDLLYDGEAILQQTYNNNIFRTTVDLSLSSVITFVQYSSLHTD